MAEPFLGEIRMFGFNFAPVGWAQCDGQLVSIAQNTALFSLLGVQFGGDGVHTFALPDLRGRMANHMGPGAGLTDRIVGQVGGAETVILTAAQLANHSHPLVANSGPATTRHPAGNFLATPGPPIYATTANETELNAHAIGQTGSDRPVDILSPFLTLNFCIALQGIFPARN
jgi:microcystin-dependent protein